MVTVQDTVSTGEGHNSASAEAVDAAARHEATAEATAAAARRFTGSGNGDSMRGDLRLPPMSRSDAGREVSGILSTSGSDMNLTPDSDRNVSEISGLATGEALTDEPRTPVLIIAGKRLVTCFTKPLASLIT